MTQERAPITTPAGAHARLAGTATPIQATWTLRRVLTAQSRVAKLKRLQKTQPGLTKLSGYDLMRIAATGPLDAPANHSPSEDGRLPTPYAALNAALKRERDNGVEENRLALAVNVEINL
jgi:hypothetical protein